MTPEAIVSTPVSEGLSLISITDHNEITGVEIAPGAAASTALVVIPGVELSTPQGHILCYLPDLDALKKFYAGLTLAGLGTQNSRCTNAMLDILGRLHPRLSVLPC
jgi:predicted metal-dependent phosphoesterase TrpH